MTRMTAEQVLALVPGAASSSSKPRAEDGLVLFAENVALAARHPGGEPDLQRAVQLHAVWTARQRMINDLLTPRGGTAAPRREHRSAAAAAEILEMFAPGEVTVGEVVDRRGIGATLHLAGLTPGTVTDRCFVYRRGQRRERLCAGPGRGAVAGDPDGRAGAGARAEGRGRGR